MREITLMPYLVISYMAIVNFGILIYTFVDSMPKSFIFLTYWSYWGSTVYLSCIFFCDTAVFFFNEEKFENVNEYIRTIYSKYCFTYGYSVVIMYWFLVCLGDNYMQFDTDPIIMFFHIYLHGFITVMLLIDLILSPRRNIRWSNLDFLIISLCFLFYIIVALIANYGFNMPPYAFMSTAAFLELLLYGLGLYALQILCYLLHIWVVSVRNNRCYQIKDTNEAHVPIEVKEMN